MVLSQVPTRVLLSAGPPFVAGLVAVGLAIRLSRTRHDTRGNTPVYTDLRRPYLWSCLAFAFGVTIYGVVRARVGAMVGADVFLMTTFAFALPWTVFSLNYVGRGYLLTARRLSFGVAYLGVLLTVSVLDVPPVRSSLGPYPDLSVIGSLLVLGMGAVVFAAGGLVLLSVYRHSTLTLSHGAVVALPMLELLFALQMIRPGQPSLALFNDVVMSGASLVAVGALFLGPTRYDVLTMRPGTGTAGERAAVREMDEVIVTTERNGTLARANSAATDLFGERLDDEHLVDIVGYEPAALADQETVECWTADGRKQFDPRVTELVTGYDEVFGYTVTLLDITDREIRRQRIEVLNRILRHNIRNSLDVIRADAEFVTDGDRAASILDTTETLERLSADARRIESLMQRAQDERSTADLTTVVTSVATDVADDHPDASVSIDVPELSVGVDAEPCRFAIQNVVENAIVHNDGTVPRVEIRGTETEAGARLVVADDGPGIPETERTVIERRSESPQLHASSLGLWGTNWAVQQLGGELSFRDSDLGGTAVAIELPAD